MPRTITIKGIGRASVKPDMVVVSMTVEAKNKDYDRAMELAAGQIGRLRECVEAVGFAKEDLKTVNFNVRTDYKNVRDEFGGYAPKFDGYVVAHNLKLEFNFDKERLSHTISAVTHCSIKPGLAIAFTVGDQTAVQEEMLRDATENARKNAEILCMASEVSLGRLLSIDYNWGELSLRSNTRLGFSEEGEASPMMARSIDIEPEDIRVSDTVTFVWEISD